MKEHIVEFNKQLNDEQKIEILQSVNAEYKGNIFANFELVVCSDEIAEELRQNENVFSVEENGHCEKCDIEAPDFPTQFINVLGNAHEKGYKGDGVVVAVIDSGINYEHEDLQIPIYKCARILNNSIVSVDVLEDVKDLDGHGTAVASVLVMQDNGKGYIGVAPNVKLIVVKATNSDDGGSMSFSSMAKAITWAVDNGADVINISYSQNNASSIVSSACQYAYNNNVSVVASAGNNGNVLSLPGGMTKSENVEYWKDYEGVVVVSAVNRKENFGGKLLPEMPLVHNRVYKYELLYYYEPSDKYTLLLSDYPMTIDSRYDNANGFQITVKGYRERYDYVVSNSMHWDLIWDRTSSDGMIVFGEGERYPDILYCNHEIINNKEGGFVQAYITSLDVYREHIVNNYGHFFVDYVDNLQNIIKASYASIGQGIDFVAPGYYYVAKDEENDSFERVRGTSFAAPFVAGMIAILRQRFPNITVDRIYDLLNSFAVTVDDGNPNYYGNGLVTMPDLSKEFVYKLYYKGNENKLEEYMMI